MNGGGSGKYKVSGKKLTLTGEGMFTNASGTIDGKNITLKMKVESSVMTLVFEKQEGASSGSGITKPSSTGVSTAAQEKWNGTWYGYMWITEFFGAYEGSEDDMSDAFMTVDIGKNGKGTMTIYLGASDEYLSFDTLGERILIKAEIIADEYRRWISARR